MKKIVSVFLAIVMICSLLTIVPVNATEDSASATAEEVAFAVSSSFGQSGDTTKVFVDVAENSMMSAAVFRLKFDVTQLQALDVEIGTVLQDGYSSANINDAGEVLVSYINTVPVYNGGRLFEVDLKIIGDAGEQGYVEIPVELEVSELVGYDYCEITPAVNNGVVAITDTQYGDVSLDKLVAPSDTLLILNYAVNLVEFDEEQFLHADVTGDGIVNAIDAMFILRHTAGVISTYPVFELAQPKEVAVVEKDETYVTLSWTAVEFACGYNVYQDGVKVNDTLLTDTSFTIDQLAQDTRYEFHITAENTLKESKLSDVVEVSTNKADRTVVFKDYDGTILNTQVVLSGNDAAAPTAPVRIGYTFTGWDKTLENITTDTVITAQYAINRYTVTFNSNGGSSVSSQTANYGSLLQKPTNPTRTDYTFMGWYTDSAFVNQWDFASDPLTKDMTLYAKWETWSAWTTSLPSGVTSANYTIQSRTETRYRTKSTTTNSASSLSGWTRYDAKITGWSAWSSWQNSAVTATDSTQVETQYIAPTYKTVWHYNRSTNGTYSTYALGYYGSNQYITLDYRLTVQGYVDGRPHYGSYTGNYSSALRNLWWNESTSQQQVTAGYTQYRYRTAIYTYYYYKWSNWSDWSTNTATSNDSTEVQTRTVYRYIPIEK